MSLCRVGTYEDLKCRTCGLGVTFPCLTFKYFAILLSFPHQVLHCHFPALGNTTKNKKLQSKLQVWLPPLALRAADKSSFHCVKGIQPAEQCKLAGPFSFQREAQSKLFWFTLEINQYGAGRGMKDPLRKERSSEYRGGCPSPLNFPTPKLCKNQRQGGVEITERTLESLFLLNCKEMIPERPHLRKGRPFCSKLS